MIRLFLVLLVSWIVIASCTEQKKVRVLPIVGNYDVEYDTINGKEVTDTIYPKIPNFTYLNQDSMQITSSAMKGKVWIADFFFTSCPSICPKMTSQMKRLAILTKDLDKHIQFISFSQSFV